MGESSTLLLIFLDELLTLGLEQINFEMPEDFVDDEGVAHESGLFVACCRKRSGRRYDFVSCLSQESRRRGENTLRSRQDDPELDTWFEPLPKIPIVTSHEVTFANGTIVSSIPSFIFSSGLD